MIQTVADTRTTSAVEVVGVRLRVETEDPVPALWPVFLAVNALKAISDETLIPMNAFPFPVVADFTDFKDSTLL